MTEALRAQLDREVVRPVLAGMAAEGTPFVGFLYCGLMLTASGPKVIEFNCRFGDPEAQVVLPLLAEPLGPLLLAASTGAALPARAAFSDDVAVGVVLASRGYPMLRTPATSIHGVQRVRAEHPLASAAFRRRGRALRPSRHGGRARPHRSGPGRHLQRGHHRGLRGGRLSSSSTACSAAPTSVPERCVTCRRPRRLDLSRRQVGGSAGTSSFSAWPMWPRKVSAACPSGTSS